MVAIFSVKPDYADRILSGEKKVEFRRVKCKKDIDTILIYATQPIAKIIGEVSVANVIEDTKEALWNFTSSCAGIEHEDFLRYYKDKRNAIAYVLEKPHRYKELLDISAYGLSTPPQSFRYLPEHEMFALRG